MVKSKMGIRRNKEKHLHRIQQTVLCVLLLLAVSIKNSSAQDWWSANTMVEYDECSGSAIIKLDMYENASNNNLNNRVEHLQISVDDSLVGSIYIATAPVSRMYDCTVDGNSIQIGQGIVNNLKDQAGDTYYTWQTCIANNSGISADVIETGPQQIQLTIPFTDTYWDDLFGTNPTFKFIATTNDGSGFGFPSAQPPYQKTATTQTKAGTPTNVQIEEDCGKVTITWIDPTEPNNSCSTANWGVRIYRDDLTTPIATIPATTAMNGQKGTPGTYSYSVAPGEHTYRVQTYWNFDSGRSSESNRVPTAGLTATSIENIDPPAITSVSSDQCNNDDGGILVTWTNQVPSPDSIRIQRSTSADFSTDIVEYTIVGQRTSYTDTMSLDPDRDYYYRLASINECKNIGAFSSDDPPFKGRLIGGASPPNQVVAKANSATNEIKVTWEDNSSDETGFIIERTFPGAGAPQVTPIGVNTEEWYDTNASQCVTYTYTVKVVTNCFPDGVGTQSDTSQLAPNLSNTFPTNGLSASKGSFTDKVELSWINNNESQTNTIKVYRRILESNDTTFILLTTLNSASGIYNDLSTQAGELYEYQIQAEGPCENNIIKSNTVRAIGFRRKTGIVTGKVFYTGGINVEDVRISASDATNTTFPSVDMNSGEIATVSDDPSLDININDGFIIETWFKSRGYSQDFNLVSKSGSYNLGFIASTGTIDFEVQTNSGPISVSMDTLLLPRDTLGQLQWNHVAGMIYEGSISLFINGKELSQALIPAGTTLVNTASDMIIGSGFNGFLKEIRFWNIGKEDKRMFQDFSRFMAGNEAGLMVYLNAGERKGRYIYDLSKVGTDFNENHAFLSHAGMWHNTESPESARLSIAAFTNQDGDYTLVVPYAGAGQSFVLTPIFGIHIFDPSSRPVFIGDGATVQNNIDFEDISSFSVSGKARFYGTNCGSEGLLVKIDGEAVISNGNAVFTDNEGNFDIQVPIGRHVITLEKNGHEFSQGRFPPLPMPDWDFQETVPGVEFVDSTFRRVIGRVVGGDREGDKIPGFGKSNNNIGIADIKFDPKGNCGWKVDIDDINEEPRRDTTTTTMVSSGEYDILLPPLEYIVYRPELINKDDVGNVINVIVDESITVDLRNIPIPMTENDTTYALDNSYTIDSISFHKQLDFIYKAPIEISVTAPDGNDLTGDDEYEFVHSKLDNETIDLTNSPFPHAVFTQNRMYETLLSTFEEYINHDGVDPVIDRVPVTSGVIVINNDLAVNESTTLNLNNIQNFDGDTTYSFIAGQPEISFPFTKDFQVQIVSGNRDAAWPDPITPYKGYIVGVKDVEQSDFATQGPDLVEFILRDPPGSQSFAERVVGTSSTVENSWEWNLGGGVDIDASIFAGTEFSLGIGYSTTTDIEASVNIGFSAQSSGGEGQTVVETITNTQTWTTSSDPLLAGAGSDLFIGTSRNYLFGISTKLALVPTIACDNSLITCPEIDMNNDYQIATQKSLAIAGDAFETQFIYTANHIETYVIPQLEELRNNFIETNSDYTDLADTNSPCYGANNDDPRWTTGVCLSNNNKPASPDPMITTVEDNVGPSYTFTDPLLNVPDTITLDSVRIWNQQIRLWQEALAYNEEQKALATENPKNYSFDGAGSSFSLTEEISSSFTQSRTFEFNFSESLGLKVGGKVAGAGIEDNYSVSLTQNRTETDNVTVDTTESVSFTISDDSEWDKFTFDVYKGSNTGGPIFKILGGRSSCPHEGTVVSKYYEPGTVLSPGSIQLEQPEITITPAVPLNNVPQDETGVFQMTLKNNNQVGETWEYATQLIAESNPNSLAVNVGSSDDLTRNWVIPPLNSITRDILVEMGTVYEYDSLLVVMHSVCQYQRGLSSEPDIADSAYFSINFIPECTSVEIENPTDQWIINNSYDDTINIRIGAYDYNYLNFDHIDFQYKQSSQSEEHWITHRTFYHPGDTTRFNNNPQFDYISNSSIITAFDWDISSLEDGDYDFRAVTDCQVSTEETEIHRGYMDRINPHAFGTPSPADGILDAGDDIIIKFNETIDPAYISDFNFDIRGKLNGTTIRQQESLAFDGTSSYGIIPEYQLQKRDLTIEFWAKRGGLGQEVIISQGNSATDQLVVGFDSNNKMFLQLGDQIATADSVINDTDWKFYAITYNRTAQAVYFYANNALQGSNESFTGIFGSSGPIVVGRNSASGNQFFKGGLQELRIWDKARIRDDIASYSGVTLSGRESGLIGNWPLDDSWGPVAEEKVRARHMQINGASWNVEPPSHSYSFNGGSDYLIVPNAGKIATLPTEDFTVETWFKTDRMGQKQTLISNGTPSIINPSFWAIGLDETGRVTIENDNHILTSNLTYNDSTWHHLAIVLERNFSLTMYIDGEVVRTDNASNFNDFAGPVLTFGALINGTGALASYSQYFEGFIDDIRFWNIARQSEQIRRDFINQLQGDESGLLAYYPFDFYDEIGGIPLLNSTLENRDTTNAGDFTIIPMGGSFSNIRPTIKLPRKIKKIIPTYSINNDEIFIDINNDPAEIENVIIDITVGGIRDLAGNYMESPETWIAYIDQNQVFWDTEYFSFEKDYDDQLSFTSKIKNTGGSQERYEISNIPSWLSVSPRTGIIEPNSEIEVAFTIASLINIGEYEQDVYVSTESFGFNERLLIDLKVTSEPPEWEVVNADFSHSMNIVGEFSINDIISIDDEDLVSVWVGDELRGVSNVTYDDASGKYLVFLTVLSNSSFGDNLVFNAWDASTGRTLTDVNPTDIVFASNDIRGSKSSPIPIAAQMLTRLTYVLNPGWNWLSFPLASGTLSSVEQTLMELESVNGDEMKSQFAFKLYFNGWQGDLVGFDTDKGYKLKINDQDTFHYEGVFQDPLQEPIAIMSGWNWIGMKSLYSIDVESAMSSLDPIQNDLIKGQYSFAIYDTLFGWGGNLSTLEPLEGYMLKYHQVDDLVFPNNGGATFGVEEDPPRTLALKSKRSYKSRIDNSGEEYSSNMSLTATVSSCLLEEQEKDISSYTLIAYVGGECRGTAEPVYIPQTESYIYYLTINGDISSMVDFELVDTYGGEHIRLGGQIEYQSNDIIGTTSAPYEFACDAVLDCPESIMISTVDMRLSEAQSMDISASQRILSDAEIPVNYTVVFKAGSQIELLDGFSVPEATEFEVMMEGCEETDSTTSKTPQDDE